MSNGEDRQRDGTGKDRDFLNHPKFQKFNAVLLWVMFVFVLGLAFTAGQYSTTIDNIDAKVTRIEAQLEKTAPNVLAARLDATDQRLDGLENWIRSLSQRFAENKTRDLIPNPSSTAATGASP